MDESTPDEGLARGYHPRPLSQVLSEMAQNAHGKPVSMRDIRDALADRSFATFLVLTCLMNLLPFPPGATLVLGVPIIAVALQMIAGREKVWLPEFFLKISLTEERFAKITKTIVPRLQKLERWLKPRYWPLPPTKMTERVIGSFALILGIFVFIPVPVSNWLPAMAGVIVGLALSERDGKWLLFGVLFGLFSMLLVVAITFFGAQMYLFFLG